MSRAGSIPLGTAEVAVTVNLDQLPPGFNRARQATQQFETGLQRTTNVVTGRFNRALNATNQAAGRFNRNVQVLSAGIGLIPGPAGAAAARITALHVAASAVGAAGTAAAFGIGAFVASVLRAVTESEKFEKINLRTEAILKATGFAAGVTGQDIRRLGEDIEATTLATSEGVQQAAQRLATFGSVSGTEFERALRLAQDLSGAFGSLEGAIVAIGRAFERPEQAARMFRQIGLHEVVLLQAQAMQDAGKEAESYTFILDELQKKVGGAGSAEASGLTGAFHRLGDAADDFFRRLGEGSSTLNKLGPVIDKFTNQINRFTDAVLGQDDATKATGVVAAEVAKKAALLATEQRKRDDARAAQIKADREAAKALKEEFESLAKAEKARLDQLEVQRESAVEAALLELSVVEDLTPALLRSGRTRADITKIIQDQIAATKQLNDLGLRETDIDASRLQSARIISDINRALLDAVGGAEEYTRAQLQVNEALREAEKLISDVTAENVIIGKPESVKAASDYRTRLLEVIEELKAAGVSTRLLEQNVDRLTGSFERATANNLSTQLLSDMVDQVDELNLELRIQIETFGKTAGASARFRFEQEALYRQMQLTGAVSAEQAADIKFLAIQYGAAVEALADLQGRQDAARATSGLLSDALRDIATQAKSVGEAALAMAEGLAEAVSQAALFGEGPFAQILGTSGSGGLFGGALNKVFGVGEAASGGAEAGASAALTSAATGLSTAVGALSGAAGGLSGAAGALSAAAAALSASAAASGGADVAGAISSAAQTLPVIHTGGTVGQPRSIHRSVPVSAFIRAPRLHNGLRQGERFGIFEDGEEIVSKRDVKRRRRAGGGDTYNMVFPGVRGDKDTFLNSQSQATSALADAIFVERKRNR